MNYKILKNIIGLVLTAILVISLAMFNRYISIYYRMTDHIAPYNIKPCYLFGFIVVLIIIQAIYIYKIYKDT